jgi:Fe-S cluster assembly protein SufD
VNGATVLTGARQSHNFLRIRHLVPHCVSRQHFKSVAADQSKSSVDGTIFVAKNAQQTNAYQLINNLMLSDEARADSKPRLMIHADDVKCSHGATSGKLDPAQQFYLESRGLPPAQARALLTVAFIAEVLEKSGKPGDGFRDGLDHALLDILRTRLPKGPAIQPKVKEGNPNG